MGIYRGPGGTGDAVNDASSEALITVQAKDAALAAQASAEAARDAALLAETNAETAEANAELAEANAETAATNAAASASAASTSASNAATSATNAANSATAAQTAETNAETAETNAAASASAASTSASNAATSASNASTSATNAANSATAAQTAQAAAEAALDQFDDTYLGAKASNPTVDNDGNPLTTGDQYFNTVANELRIWNGSSWQAASTVGGTVSSLTVTGAFAANGSTTIGDAAGDSVTINASTVSTPNGISFNGTSIPASKTLVVTTDIGSTVQAYDADTAKYDDVTANFTGTLQNGGSNVVVDSDIGVTVQAYDAQLADVAGLTPADNNFIVGNGTNFVTESGSTARTSLGLGSIATQDANNVAVTGGSINGTTVGASTPSTGAFTTLSATGDVTIADKIVHSGDTDTAVRFPAADTVTVETSGAERLRIDSSGNVGIGVSPATRFHTQGGRVRIDANSENFALQLNNSTTGNGCFLGSAGADTFVISASSGAERMRIDSSGNVGIGTSSPSYKLHVQGGIGAKSASGNVFLIANSGDVTSLQVASDGSANYLYGTGAVPLTFSTNATERMRITADGNVGIKTNAPEGILDVNNSGVARLLVGYGNTPNNYYDVDNHIFRSTNATERMRIDSSGRLLIGTSTALSTSPRLQVQRKDATVGATNYQLAWFQNATGFGNGIGLYAQDNVAGISADFAGASGGAAALAFYTNSTTTPLNPTERMRITSGGDLLVGTTAAISSTNPGLYYNTGASLDIGRTGTSNVAVIYFFNGNGNIGSITTSGSATAYNTSSDYRLKKDIAPMTGALNKVSQLKPVTYKWKVDGSTGEGFIAHELQAIVPDAVVGEKDAVNEDGSIKPQGIDTSFLVATLTAAIQEQQAMIVAMQKEIAELKAK